MGSSSAWEMGPAGMRCAAVLELVAGEGGEGDLLLHRPLGLDVDELAWRTTRTSRARGRELARQNPSAKLPSGAEGMETGIPRRGG